MTDLERKRCTSELKKVEAARLDMEARIMELQDEINRLKDFIVIQETKEAEIKERLK